MAIKIVRNDQGNCINFYGSSNPTYWNACLSGEVDPTDSTLVNIKNDIKTAEAGETQYEFFRIPYTEFRDEDNNSFDNAQAVSDYITLKGNVTIGVGVTYKGIWDASTNTPDITTDPSTFVAGDFYNLISSGTHDLGSGDVDFINGDEVIFDGTDWLKKPYAGALIEYDSTSILLNNNASVYADGAQGSEEPNGAEDGWYFKNDEAGKKINWYFLGNQNAGYQINKSTLEGGYVRMRLLTPVGVDSPFFSLYTTPKGDGFDSFWFRSRYSYTGDFTGIAANQEVIAYWGENPSVSPELTRVELTYDSFSSQLSTAPDISNDEVYTMALSTNSSATVDSLEFIAKELGYKNQQYLRSYILEAKLENIIVDDSAEKDLTDVVLDFKLDDTSTSIMLDNGFAFGVNTIKAIDTGDGLITIKSIQGELTHFFSLDSSNVTIDGSVASGGLSDVINKLNELFTVGAFESVVIADPYSTMVADVAGEDTNVSYVGYGLDPVGNDIYGSSNSNSQNGLITTESINQSGEYFTFDIRSEGTIGFGLVHTQASYDAGHYSGNSNYADPTTFGVANSAHYGFQFSHWFHPTPNGSWTNYGSNTSYSMRSGWSNFNGTDEQADWLAGNPIKVRVGIDSSGYISIETLRDGVTWVPHSRTSYPVPQGSEYRLGIKTNHTGARVYNIPKVHLLEEAAPTMYFRYIESPDGQYSYPLFATAEEANYFNTIKGGAGASHAHVYVDDPTQTTWYMPDAYGSMNVSVDPIAADTDDTNFFEGNAINWTEITTLTNADLVPTAFSDNSFTVNELSAVNIQLHPTGASYITSIVDTDGSGLTIDVNGIHLNGTSPEVTGDNVSNPSDTYTIEVVRTNSYGSSSGTLTLNVSNLTAPVIAISGFNHEAVSTSMIDSDTMDSGSVVHVNGNVADGERFVIEKAYVESNILPSLTEANDKYIIGVANNPHDFSTLELTDFDAAIVWEYESSTSHTFKFYRDGVVQQNIVIGSLTQSFYDYAIEVNGTSAWLIACNLNNIMNEASPADGGAFSNTYEATNIEDTAPVKIHMAVLNTTGDISTTDIETITTPTPAPSNLTPWTKALNFSGGSEHLKQVTQSTGSNAIRMGGLSQLATANSDSSKTSSHTYSRPWATAIVFQTPNNTTNQHIWNSGEGAGTGDDNIYLRMTGSNGELYFGWGREGVGYNEYHIGNFGGSYNQSTGQWWGIYISHDGTRLNAADATATNLTNAFDIRLMGTNDTIPVFSNLYNVGNDVNNWTSTGARMDRAIIGDFTIGGRGSNRSFHGRVASMVVTTLRKGVTKPTDAEIQLMLTDPMKWEDDYKDGVSARYSYSGSNFIYGSANSNSKYATQIWLMGDGINDSYANGIRNHVDPTDQNYVKLQINSMVSNDIETVNINGLT